MGRFGQACAANKVTGLPRSKLQRFITQAVALGGPRIGSGYLVALFCVPLVFLDDLSPFITANIILISLILSKLLCDDSPL
jgi:hypothetical protein